MKVRVRWCRVIIAGMLLLAIIAARIGYLKWYSQSPHLDGAAVSSIEIEVDGPIRSENTDCEDQDIMDMEHMKMTNATDCADLLALLNSARPREEHKCGEKGLIALHYVNGSTTILMILPGHDPAGYEFRSTYGLFGFSRERFFQILRHAGLDTSKVPTTCP